MNIYKRRKCQQGFALLEVVIATAILGTVGVSLLFGLSTGVMGSHAVSQKRTALTLAQSQMDFIKASDLSSAYQWDDLDAQGNWYGEDATVAVDGGDYQEGSSCLRIVSTDDEPIVKVDSLGGLDWSMYAEVQLWAKADGADVIRLTIRDSDNDWECFEQSLAAANDWQWLQYDLSSPDNFGGEGPMDWSKVNKIDIKAMADHSYTFRVDGISLWSADYHINQWESFDAVGSWTSENTDETLSSDSSDYREWSDSLRIEGDESDNPGAKRTGLPNLDWSKYTDVLLSVKADTADVVRLQVSDADGNYEYFDSTLSQANTWEDLTYDLTSPDGSGGTLDWTNITEVHITAQTTSDNYTFRIDGLCLKRPHYEVISTDDLPDGWTQSQISISVQPKSLILQLIAVTVSYDGKTTVLEGYKAKY